MKPIKTIMEFLITGCVCTALLILPMTLQTEAETELASPCAGVGRIAREENEMISFKMDGKGGFTDCKFIDEDGTETILPDIFGGDESSTDHVETETIPETECVEVIPEPEPIVYTDIDALIAQVAVKFGLPWELVRAVCYVESGFDPNAISSTGDYGLMQVSYINHGWLGLENPLDPYENLCAGCAILKTAIDNSDGDLTKALMRYNRGDAYAMSQWSQGIFSTAYTEKVLERYYAYLRGEY